MRRTWVDVGELANVRVRARSHTRKHNRQLRGIAHHLRTDASVDDDLCNRSLWAAPPPRRSPPPADGRRHSSRRASRTWRERAAYVNKDRTSCAAPQAHAGRSALSASRQKRTLRSLQPRDVRPPWSWVDKHGRSIRPKMLFPTKSMTSSGSAFVAASANLSEAHARPFFDSI